MTELEKTLRIELAIRMRYEMEMWQVHGFSADRLEHHVDMIVRRILPLEPTTLNKERRKDNE